MASSFSRHLITPLEHEHEDEHEAPCGRNARCYLKLSSRLMWLEAYATLARDTDWKAYATLADPLVWE